MSLSQSNLTRPKASAENMQRRAQNHAVSATQPARRRSKPDYSDKTSSASNKQLRRTQYAATLRKKYKRARIESNQWKQAYEQAVRAQLEMQQRISTAASRILLSQAQPQPPWIPRSAQVADTPHGLRQGATTQHPATTAALSSASQSAASGSVARTQSFGGRAHEGLHLLADSSSEESDSLSSDSVFGVAFAGKSCAK